MRYSLYREVHKGIRSLLGELVVRSGQLDWSDAPSVSGFRSDVQEAFALLSSHAEHENEFVAPALAAHAPAVAEVLGGAHDDQEDQLHALLVQLHAIDPSDPSAEDKGHAFVVTLSRIAGELLVHMADEEDIAMPALWSALDDAAILAIEQRLVGSIPPEKMAKYLAWMLPAMNNPERIGMLAGMKEGAPPEVYAFVRGLAEEVLSANDNAALERGLTMKVAEVA
jgi:hypothetical protein